MALTDSVTERYALFDSTAAELEPQVRGLRDKIDDDLSSELRAALQARLDFLNTVADQINTARSRQQSADSAFEALEASGGFPTIPDTELSQQLLDELAMEDADSAAASGGFEAIPKAANLEINLGIAVDKP